MRTQFLFSVLVGIAVSGCEQCEYSCVPQNTVDAESPDEFIPDDVPFSRIETTDINGREEVRTVMVTMLEERNATVPPGEDISKFLRMNAGGRIIDYEPDVRFDDYVDPAPAPPEPSDAVIRQQLQVLTSIAVRQ